MWGLWRRCARDLVVVARHVASYLISRLRVDLVGSRWTRSQAGSARRRATAAQHTRGAIEALGRPLHELFDWFVDAPLACASIGQAHAATLLGGTDVVVKVRRPGVVDEVELDLEVITSVVSLLSRSSPPSDAMHSD